MPIHRVRLFCGTTAEWAQANPLLQQGDIGIDTTTGEFKRGNGRDRWAALDPMPAPTARAIASPVATPIELPSRGEDRRTKS